MNEILFMSIGKCNIKRVTFADVFNSILMSPAKLNEYQLMLYNKLNCLDWWANDRAALSSGFAHFICGSTGMNIQSV